MSIGFTSIESEKPTITKDEVGTILYVILAGRPYTAHQFREYRDTLINWLQSKGLAVIQEEKSAGS